MKKSVLIGMMLILGAFVCFYNEDLAQSYNIRTDDAGHQCRWPGSKLPVQYFINKNGTPDCTDEFNAVKAAFKTWADVNACSAGAEYGGDTTVGASDSKDKPVVIWDETTSPGDATTYAKTNVLVNSLGEITDADIILNGKDFTWATGGDPKKADVQAIVTHEAGHFFGLEDSAVSAAVMYKTFACDDTTRRKLNKDDTDGICKLYPGPADTPTTTPTANVTPTPSAGLIITTDALPYGRLEEYYEFQLDAIGGTAPYTFSIENGELPDGLKMDEDGLIVGNPLAVCEKLIAFIVTDSNGKFSASVTMKLSIYAADAVVGPIISNGVLPTGYVGSLYQATLAVGGGLKPYRVIVYYTSALPSGLSMSLDGKISGVPATTYDQDVEFMVTDAEGKFNRKTLRLTILPADDRPADVSFDVLLDKDAFNVSDLLSLKVAVSGSGYGDVYVAMIKPNGNFQTLALSGQLSQENEVLCLVSQWQVTPGVYTAFSSNVQQNWAPGTYSWYIIITKPGASPLDLNNWTVWTFKDFKIN